MQIVECEPEGSPSPAWVGFFQECARLAQISRTRRREVLNTLPRACFTADGSDTVFVTKDGTLVGNQFPSRLTA